MAPSFFGVKPEMVLLGGTIVCAQMGDPNASIPTPQPVFTRSMFGSFGKSLERSSVTFVSKLSNSNGIREKLGISKETISVKNTRDIGKASMILNNHTPEIEVNPETYEVYANGELLTCEPADVLPMAQRYFMY